VLKRVCDDIPRPIQDVIPGTPDWLCTIVNRLLEKKREDRFQTAKEETQSRNHALGHVHSAAALSLPQMAKLGHRVMLAGVLIAALAIIAILFLSLGDNKQNDHLANTAASEERQPSESATASSNLKYEISNAAKANWHGWPADAPAPAIAPFDAKQAKAYQDAWATYLNVPPEYTNTLGMRFRLIPPGEFTMGSTPEEIETALQDSQSDAHRQGCVNSSGPQHNVTLTQPIYLGVHELTQNQYAAIMQINPSYFSTTGLGNAVVGGLDTENCPVDGVRWTESGGRSQVDGVRWMESGGRSQVDGRGDL